MSIIVYRDGIMAADSIVVDRGVHVASTSEKIWRAPDGGLVACCGALGEIMRFREFLETGKKTEMANNFEGLQIYPDGTQWWWGPDLLPARLESSYHAIGYAFEIALGALAMGAAAPLTVSICCDLSVNCALPVVTVELHP